MLGMIVPEARLALQRSAHTMVLSCTSWIIGGGLKRVCVFDFNGLAWASRADIATL